MKKIVFVVMAMFAIGFATSCGNKQAAPADVAEVNVDSIATAAADEGLAVLGSQLEIKDADKIQAAIDALRAKVAELDPAVAKEYVAKVQTYLKENADKIKEAVGDNAAINTAIAAFTAADPEAVVSTLVEQAGEAATNAATDAKDAAVDAVNEKVDEAKQAAEDKANEVKEAAEQKVQDAKDAAKQKATDAIDNAAANAKSKLGL